MDRVTWYDGLKVDKAIVEETFDKVENATNATIVDSGVSGIVDGGSVTQHSPSANVSIDIQPFVARTQQGERVNVPGLVNLLLGVDTDGVPTDVSLAGQEKYLGIFVKYIKNQTDPRIDKFNQSVFFRRSDFYEFKIVQGVQAAVGTATKPTHAGATFVRICDVLRTFAQTQIFNADISFELQELRTIGDAAEIQYDDDPGNFGPAVLTVEDAIDEMRTDQVADELAITSLQTVQAELVKRYHSFGATDIRLYLDPDANLLYSMKAELYDFKCLSLAHDGTRFCLVFNTTDQEGRRRIYARLFETTGGGTYQNEVLIAEGDVFAPKVVWNGGSFSIFWVEGTTAAQIRMRRLSTSNTILGTTVNDINDSATKGINTTGLVNLKKHYSIAADGVDKCAVVWTSANKVYYRSVTVSTGTLGSVVTVDNGGVTTNSYDDPSVAFGNSHFGIAYRNITVNRYSFRPITAATDALAQPEVLSSAFPTISSGNIYCIFSALNNRFVFVGLDSTGNSVRVFRSASPYSAIVEITPVVNDGGTVTGIHGLLYNPDAQLVVPFFSDSSRTNKVSFKEITDDSTAGSAARFIASNNTYYDAGTSKDRVSDFIFISGASNNYQVIANSATLTAPFDLRRLLRVYTDDQVSGGTGTSEEFFQGHGGALTYILNTNARRSVRYRFVQFDGQSIALADGQLVFTEIAPADYTNGSEGITDKVYSSGSDLTTFNAYASGIFAYNKPFVLYRKDSLLGAGGLVIGPQSYSLGNKKVWYPTASPVQESDVNASIDALKASMAAGSVPVAYSSITGVPAFALFAELEFDFVINRANFASDSLAGTALRTALTSGAFKSIFIKPGTYDLGTTQVSLSSVITTVQGSGLSSIIKFTNVSQATDGAFRVNADGAFRDFTVQHNRNTAGSLRSIIEVNGLMRTQFYNIWTQGLVDTGVLTPATVTATNGFNCTVINPLMSLRECRATGHLHNFAANVHGGIDGVRMYWGKRFDACRNMHGISLYDLDADTHASFISGGTYTMFLNCFDVADVIQQAVLPINNYQVNNFIMFNGCRNVTLVNMTSAQNLRSVNSMHFFLSCTNVSNVIMSYNNIDVSTPGASAFSFVNTCFEVSNINISVIGNITSSNAVAGITLFLTSEHLSNIKFSHSGGNISASQARIFQGCNYITNTTAAISISHGASDTTHGFHTCYYVSNCTMTMTSANATSTQIIYFNSRLISNCTAVGAGTTTAIDGYSTCRPVIGCYANNCGSRSYFTCEGTANTDTASGAAAATTNYANFTTTVAAI